MVAHDLAGLRYVAELFGQLQQGQLALGTLCGRGHRSSPCSWFVWSLTNLPETPVPALNQADCRVVTKPLQKSVINHANGDQEGWSARVLVDSGSAQSALHGCMDLVHVQT